MFYLEQTGSTHAEYRFDLRDRGLLLADGVFDTSLVTGGVMILRAVHVERLVRAASSLQISLDPQKVHALLDTALSEESNGVLRISVTSGPAERGLLPGHSLTPTILMSLSPLDASLQFQPITLQTSPIRRNQTSLTSRLKTLAYVDHIAAMRHARANGYDDALFLNSQGNLCCSTVGNLFLKIGDIWVTPPVEDGVVPGVMRQWLLNCASELGLKTMERSISEEELQQAESAFMMNSVRLAAPIRKMNTHILDPKFPKGLQSAIRALITNPSMMRS